MAFCINCGARLQDGAQFCHTCGTPNNHSSVDGQPKREFEYAGKIVKCPNCGEPLSSFQARCPACGHELREAHASKVVKELADKLEAIDKEPDDNEKKDHIPKRLAPFVLSEKDKKKISLIKSFPIPNTKEDLFEFLIMAFANSDYAHIAGDGYLSASEEAISDAWKTKYDQAYEKAIISFGESPELLELNNTHSKKAQRRNILKLLPYIGFGVFMLIMFISFFGDFANIGLKSENAKMQAYVDEAYNYLAKGDTVRARAAASKIVFAGSNSIASWNAADEWDDTRDDIFRAIEEAEDTIKARSHIVDAAQVILEIECSKNILLNKYDVEIYVDNVHELTLDHGGNAVLAISFTKGMHAIRFENADNKSVSYTVEFEAAEPVTLKYKISCANDILNVETYE